MDQTSASSRTPARNPTPALFDRVPVAAGPKQAAVSQAGSDSAGQESGVYVAGGLLTATKAPTPKGAKPNPPKLPPRKVFSIQIGTELFRLSGASISSDAPSYFSRFFEEQLRQDESGRNVRTLYIDRDPETFRDICLHLQGYHVIPRNSAHFIKLFADAQFYALPRLFQKLVDGDIHMQIGDRHFQISRELFAGPGDSPNFFSIGFGVHLATPPDVTSEGLDQLHLLRPPPIEPPAVPHRSAEVFSQLLHLLRGYPVRVKDEQHREELLRDARYFHLRGLEQRLIAHDISYNPERGHHEITLKLQDIKPSGIRIVTDASRPQDRANVFYSRPFVDQDAYELIVEVGEQGTVLDVNTMIGSFHGSTKARILSLMQTIMEKYGQGKASTHDSRHDQTGGPKPEVNIEAVKMHVDEDTCIVLNGAQYVFDSAESGVHRQESPSPESSVCRAGTKRKRTEDTPLEHKAREKWTIRKGQWRLYVQAAGHVEVIFHAVKLDAYTSQRGRNLGRRFLS